jgi:hypothetical protein
MKKHLFKEGNYTFSKGIQNVSYYECEFCKYTIRPDMYDITKLDKQHSICSESVIHSNLAENISGIYDCTLVNNKLDKLIFKLIHFILKIRGI